MFVISKKSNLDTIFWLDLVINRFNFFYVSVKNAMILKMYLLDEI